MTLDNGTSIVVPQVISTSLNYHLVKVYENHCESCAYKPLSTSSLLRILDQCKFSQRKQLTGIDNYTGDGIEGFKILEKLLSKMNLDGNEKKSLECSRKAAPAYLKGAYRSHVPEKESTCPPHCRMFALSNPKDEDLMHVCDHDHSALCNECENVFYCLDNYHTYISS